jgi:hypothetical protein
VLDGREIGVRFQVGAEIFRSFAAPRTALRDIQYLIQMLQEAPFAKIKWVKCKAFLSYTSSLGAESGRLFTPSEEVLALCRP